MRRLKVKYEKNAGKAINSEDRTFSKANQQKAYDLSKKVWGKKEANYGGEEWVYQDKRLTPAEIEQLLASLRAPPKYEESILFNKSIVGGGLVESFMKDGLALIDCAKRSELEEKWRKLQVAETEIFLRVIELNREQNKLVLDANKKH